MTRQLATSAGVSVGATLLMGGAAQAATFTVGTTDDASGATDCAVATNTDCTLRDAIDQANGDPGSTITFRSGVSGTITLESSLPLVFVPMTISGPGADRITVSGDDAYRPFDLDPVAGADVLISGLTIAHGDAPTAGGGIRSKYADLTLRDAVVSGNFAQGEGGGVAAYSGGSLTIENTTLSGNAGNRGSGVFTGSMSGTSATIRNSTISGNTDSDFGGGAYLDFSSPATLENSTVYGNSASSSGGGVYHYGRPGGSGLTIIGSTITHNTADRGGGVASFGGEDVTQPVIRNSIVSNNTASAGADVSGSFDPDPLSSITAAFSLIGIVDPNSPLDQTGPNIIGQDPELGPLAANGGATQTQKPAITSPVLDQGAAFGLSSDERGQGRPFVIPTIANAPGGDGSDIGAVELQASELPSNAFTAKLKGNKVVVTVSAAGRVGVADAKAPPSASESKKKGKKRKLFLKGSSGSGGPPAIAVPLRLTKLAKQKLRRNGRLGLKARVTFTPDRGIPSTRSVKLKVKGKKRKK